MSIGDRLVVAMEPGQRYEVEQLAAAIREDYSSTVFGIERLRAFGFVNEVDDFCFELSPTGAHLHRIITSRSH